MKILFLSLLVLCLILYAHTSFINEDKNEIIKSNDISKRVINNTLGTAIVDPNSNSKVNVNVNLNGQGNFINCFCNHGKCGFNGVCVCDRGYTTFEYNIN